MEDEYAYKVVPEEKVEDVVMVINDWYNNSDICGYTLPVPETPDLQYSIVNDEEVDYKDKYHEVSYVL